MVSRRRLGASMEDDQYFPGLALYYPSMRFHGRGMATIGILNVASASTHWPDALV
jgi:hypothetical protein